MTPLSTKKRSASGRAYKSKVRSKHDANSYRKINDIALASFSALLDRWLPDGKTQGREYIALNPKRADGNAGSFKVNIHNGKWSDFATGDKGGDVISLAAYLFDLSQLEAKQKIQNMLGVYRV